MSSLLRCCEEPLSLTLSLKGEGTVQSGEQHQIPPETTAKPVD